MHVLESSYFLVKLAKRAGLLHNSKYLMEYEEDAYQDHPVSDLLRGFELLSDNDKRAFLSELSVRGLSIATASRRRRSSLSSTTTKIANEAATVDAAHESEDIDEPGDGRRSRYVRHISSGTPLYGLASDDD